MILHKGRENVIRNNIFAHGRHACVEQSNVDHNPGFTFLRNIVLSDGTAPVVMGGYACDILKTRSVFEANLYWAGSPNTAVFGNVRFDENPHFAGVGMNEWSQSGFDRTSLEADPMFRNLGQADFVIQDSSPARGIGFQGISLLGVGPRQKDVEAEEAFVSSSEMKFG
jgi:hypothetical protein